MASGDTDAISAAEQGIRLAESLLERRSGFHRAVSPELNEKHKRALSAPHRPSKEYVGRGRGARFKVDQIKLPGASGKKAGDTK